MFSFQLTKATETGISDAHLLISAYMKTPVTATGLEPTTT